MECNLWDQTDQTHGIRRCRQHDHHDRHALEIPKSPILNLSCGVWRSVLQSRWPKNMLLKNGRSKFKTICTSLIMAPPPALTHHERVYVSQPLTAAPKYSKDQSFAVKKRFWLFKSLCKTCLSCRYLSAKVASVSHLHMSESPSSLHVLTNCIFQHSGQRSPHNAIFREDLPGLSRPLDPLMQVPTVGIVHDLRCSDAAMQAG